MPQLAERLQRVRVDEPSQTAGLQMFGLRWENGRRLDYTTLDEALAAGTLEITEVTEGGSVPTLKVINNGDTMAFLMAGEQLVGAKQNRVLNASIMVAARTNIPVPVSCVESGRWGYRSRRFDSSGTSSHSFLRKIMSAQVKRSYRATGEARSDQAAVWGEVARKLDSMGSSSDTSALNQAYADHEDRLRTALAQLRPPDGASGVAFAFGGSVAGCDLFDRPETLAKLWPKLVRAYAIDALEEPENAAKVTAGDVREWLRSSAQAKTERFKSAGLGDDIRLESPTLVGACLIVEEEPVHVEMFAETAS